MQRKEKGNLGEILARDYLKKNKYRILETNYRCRSGEIDIIAVQAKTLVFIEVRTKSNNNFGSPEESITVSKMEHFESAVFQYLQTHRDLPELWRIDLVAVELDVNSRAKRIEIIENAFE
jgi:putative endonuclease